MDATGQPIVIDNGSGSIKAGFAGGELPSSVVPTIVGTPKYAKVMAVGVDSPSYVGSQADELRGILRLRHPQSHGMIDGWADMERLWEHIYLYELKASSTDHSVLLTEPALQTFRQREQCASIFFEKFGCPSLFVSMQAVLSLYAAGKTTGLVLDSGDGVTQAVPVFEGWAISHGINRADYGGRDISNYLALLLRRSGFRFQCTSSEMRLVSSLKEKVCRVSPQPLPRSTVTDFRQLPLDAAAGASAAAGVAGGDSSGTASAQLTAMPYVLPDGKELLIGAERFVSSELMFEPSLVGLEALSVTDLVLSSVNKCDVDLRKTLFSEMLLSGGNTLLQGFGFRLFQELRQRNPHVKIKISAPPERKYSAWIGGSVLASLESFSKMCISKAEWQEEGSRVLHRKLI